MRPRSIRLRLTAWYFAVLAAALAAFGGGLWLAMRESIHEAVDEELAERLGAVEAFLSRHLPGRSAASLSREFREHTGLDPARGLIQVLDGSGAWVYRSPAMEALGVRVPPGAPGVRGARYDSVPTASGTVRVLTARLTAGGGQFVAQVATPLHEFEEVRGRFGWLVLTLAPVFLAIATAGGYWMSRRALAPVDDIISAARSVSERNLSRRLAVPRTGDELQRLSETLNEMIGRLDEAFQRIVRFTADASHELRTPVAVMRTAAELALRRQRTSREYRQAIGQILAELERTSRLIDDLMLLARSDAGAEGIETAEFDLSASVREACEQGRVLADAREVAFRSELPESPVPVCGDAQAVRRLFLILIDNAVKYTPPGGEITVIVSSGPGLAWGEVRDNGIGIAEADLPFIFDRFYRADKARSREMGSPGLGLSIAKWIAEAHGGRIDVWSRPGEGSRFRVQLPDGRG